VHKAAQKPPTKIYPVSRALKVRVAGDTQYFALEAIALGQEYPWKCGMDANGIQNIYGINGF
jgi:hypothetical protein